jgi:hypothetical protein
MFMSRNHRKSRLYSICSHSIRSLRTVYSAIRRVAFSSRSGGIEGRPTELYICSNTGESVRSASSARVFTCLSGWSSGTLFSGVTRLSIDPCFVSLPLTTPSRSYRRGAVDPLRRVFQHPVKAARAERLAVYRRIREARDLAFRGLVDTVSALLAPLDCTSVDLGPSAVNPYNVELGADGSPKGKLVARHHRFIGPDGEDLFVGLEGVTDFTKPWPYPNRPGLFARGYLNIVSDDKPLAAEVIELGLSGELSKFYVAQGDRNIELDHNYVERAARILVGATLPALASPWHNQATTISIGQHVRDRIWPIAERMGLADSSEPLAKIWLQVMLASPPELARDARTIGSSLGTLFNVSYGSRSTVVQSAAEAISKEAEDVFLSIYRVDVTAIDPTTRTLTVEADVLPVGDVAASWQFHLTFPA